MKLEKTKEKNFISAVIYIHNDQEKISVFAMELYRILKEKFLKFEMIFVDDASTDQSAEIIRTTTKQFEGCAVSILSMSYHQGVELSMNAGVDLSIGDFVYEFDSILKDYQTELIEELYQVSLEGYDIVCASPQNGQSIGSKLFYQIFNRFAHMEYMLQTERFRILSRRAINRVNSMSKTIPYRKAVYANCGLHLKNIRYKNEKAEKKKEKKDGREKRELALNSLLLFTDIVYRITSVMTMAMMGITFIMAVYAMTVFLTGKPIEGWTTLVLFVSVSFFGLFAILTMIVKYQAVILDLNFKKKTYTFDGIEKISK